MRSIASRHLHSREGSVPLLGLESLPLGGLLACDITLLDRDTDLLLLAVPLVPLPDDAHLLPDTALERHSVSADRSSPPEPLSPVVPPPQDLSRHGPFDVSCAPSDTGDHPLLSEGLPGCPCRLTYYDIVDVAEVDPACGLRLHHPMFLEYVGAPESARLLTRTPGHWVQAVDWGDAVAMALQLQHDSGIMTSNLQVLGQFVASLNRMSSGVMGLAFGKDVLPSDAVDASSSVLPCTAHYMASIDLWRPSGGPGAPGSLPISSCNDCMKCSECFPGLSK